MTVKLLLTLASLMFSSLSFSQGWSGQGELGFVKISGNTDSENLNLGLSFTHEGDKWSNGIDIQAYQSSNDNMRSANSLAIDYLLQRSLNERSNLFLSLGYLDDDFDGFTEQLSVAFGYGHKFYNTEATQWEVGTGVGYRDTDAIIEGVDPVDGSSIPSSSLRVNGPTFVLRSDYEYQLTSNTRIIDYFKAELGSDNSFIENEAAIQVAMNDKFALKVGVLVRHNTDPAPDIKNTDTISTVSLLYTLGN